MIFAFTGPLGKAKQKVEKIEEQHHYQEYN